MKNLPSFLSNAQFPCDSPTAGPSAQGAELAKDPALQGGGPQLPMKNSSRVLDKNVADRCLIPPTEH